MNFKEFIDTVYRRYLYKMDRNFFKELFYPSFGRLVITLILFVFFSAGKWIKVIFSKDEALKLAGSMGFGTITFQIILFYVVSCIVVMIYRKAKQSVSF